MATQYTHTPKNIFTIVVLGKCAIVWQSDDNRVWQQNKIDRPQSAKS